MKAYRRVGGTRRISSRRFCQNRCHTCRYYGPRPTFPQRCVTAGGVLPEAVKCALNIYSVPQSGTHRWQVSQISLTISPIKQLSSIERWPPRSFPSFAINLTPSFQQSTLLKQCCTNACSNMHTAIYNYLKNTFSCFSPRSFGEKFTRSIRRNINSFINCSEIYSLNIPMEF